MFKLKFEICVIKPGFEFEIDFCKWKLGTSAYGNQYRKWVKLHFGVIHFGFFLDDDICNSK
jgi:hypothetical protein